MSDPQLALASLETVVATVVDENGLRRYRDALEPRRSLDADIPPTAATGSLVLVAVTGLGAARQLEVLANPGTALFELYQVLLTSGLTPCFPVAVHQEVAKWSAAPGLDDPALHDLEALPFVTIDGEHSRDLDQALCLTRTDDGLVVYYAIADASYYVEPGTALFDAALQRGASFYLPSVMVPMLPKALSEGLVSLNPEVTRRAIVFRSALHADGTPRETTVIRARIRSRAKLHFAQVQAFYDAPESSPLSHCEFSSSLNLLPEFAALRTKLAREQNVVHYRRTEVQVELPGKEVRRFVVTRALRTAVETYNEQLSLLCNAEGARLLERASGRPLIEPIFRVHPPPDDELLASFRRLTARLAELHGLDRRWVWQPHQSLAQYLATLPSEPRTVLDALNRQAVMLNGGSSFQPSPGAHFGVGSAVYGRFSAPMREIVGVFLHRELTQSLGQTPNDDDALRAAVIERANQARQLQKRITNESNLLVLDQLFEDQLGAGHAPLPATIVGLTPSKVHVTLDAPPVDAKVHLDDLRAHLGSDVRVSQDACQILLAGETLFRLGDPVQVVVLGHDVKRQRWRLGLAPAHP